jgi:hypothetical protein
MLENTNIMREYYNMQIPENYSDQKQKKGKKNLLYSSR